MPMPLSLTSKRTRTCAGCCSITWAASSTLPVSVNLTALDSRLSRTCRSRWPSTMTRWGRRGSMSARSARFFCSARRRTLSRAMSSSARMSTALGFSATLPASMLATSSTSLISSSRCRPESRISCSLACWPAGTVESICISWVKPRMAFSGVRNSWLIVARKRPLAWLAASARSLASLSSAVRSATSSSRCSRWRASSASASRRSEMSLTMPSMRRWPPSASTQCAFTSTHSERPSAERSCSCAC
mmetsp:Transcript_3280/g.11534  ORF Transcript_3280/g.11534 Transcript_3280/m.11534 type:complete len:246 (-) Transcript_3280:425-1162(-)